MRINSTWLVFSESQAALELSYVLTQLWAQPRVCCVCVLNSLTFFHQVSDVCLVLGANTNLSLICQKRLQLRIVDEWIKKCILEGRNEREIIHCKLRQGLPDCVTLKKLICLNKQWPQCSVTSTSKPVVCIYWFPCLDICWATFSYFSFQTRVSWEHSSFHLNRRCGFTGRGHLAHQHHANFIWEYSTPLSSHQFYLFFPLSSTYLVPNWNRAWISVQYPLHRSTLHIGTTCYTRKLPLPSPFSGSWTTRGNCF